MPKTPMPVAVPILVPSAVAAVLRRSRLVGLSIFRAALSSSSCDVMEETGRRSPTLLVLSGKATAEDVLARSLKSRSSALKLLSEEGEEERVEVLLHSDLDSVSTPSFKSRLYLDALSTSLFGRLLLWSPRISSTHDLVSKNFEELPLGSVCIADVQFKGRGRVKNVWESPPGCLMFSFTSQMEDGHKLPLLQYVVSLAMTEAIKELCQQKGLHQIDVRIKWPNDLYLNGLKVGGILCTSTYRAKKFNISAGIGLNVDNERPTTCLNAVLCENDKTGSKLRREEILALYFNKFECLLKILLDQGFADLEELYYRSWLHSGQKVVIEEKREDQSIEEIEVIVQGLTSSGYLLAIDEDNNRYELHPDGNSFDFFKGLVRRKLG